jgi:large subunit ribosomal protein L18
MNTFSVKLAKLLLQEEHNMKTAKVKKAALRRRHHVRKKIFGTPDRPRLSVFRSNRHIYAQIIDDTAGATLVSAGTRVKAMKGQLEKSGNKKAAEIIGEAVAKQALSVGIKCVCFDRNRYRYHGRVRSLAEAARKAGLVF